MTGTGWALLIGGGVLAYLLIQATQPSVNLNPLQNILPNPAPSPAPTVTSRPDGSSCVIGPAPQPPGVPVSMMAQAGSWLNGVCTPVGVLF
jgi:hypothetical protein